MRRLTPWLTGLAAILLAAILVYVLELFVLARESGTRPKFFVPGSQSSTSWPEMALLVAVMLAGLVAGHLFEQMKQASGTVSITAELRNMTHNARFWMALLIGPIVFMSIYIAIKDRPHTLADYLLAFQNGFWWETVLTLNQGEPQGASSSPAATPQPSQTADATGPE